MKKMSGGIKSLGGVLAIYLICAASSVWADVTLELPKTIKMFALNGKELSFKENRATNIVKLPDGVNQIVIRFEGLIGRVLSSESETKYSEMIVLKFTAVDKTVEMKIPTIESTYQFEKFDKDPDIKLVDSTGNAIAVDMGRLKSDGFQITRNYEKELLAFNGTDSPAAVKTMPALTSPAPPAAPPTYQTPPTAPPTHPAAPVAPVSALPQGAIVPSAPVPGPAVTASPAGMPLPQGANMPEIMLKYWYDQADAATRERFKAWMNK